MTWPISDRADSLHVDYHYIRRMVGNAMGYGYNHAEWDDEQNQIVQEIIDEGMSEYYYPPALPPPFATKVGEVHEWNFLRPTWELDTAGDQRRYPLPEDFERPDGTVTYRDTDGDYYGPLHQASPVRLQQLENREIYTSPPVLYAIDTESSTGEGPQQQTLVLHPTPDGVYRLRLRYVATVRRLTEEQPYPLGGQAHGRGVLAACLSVAEYRRDGIQGQARAAFLERLASNVVRDRQRGARVLGYNGNAANEFLTRSELRRRDGIFSDPTTVGNTLYNG